MARTNRRTQCGIRELQGTRMDSKPGGAGRLLYSARKIQSDVRKDSGDIVSLGLYGFGSPGALRACSTRRNLATGTVDLHEAEINDGARVTKLKQRLLKIIDRDGAACWLCGKLIDLNVEGRSRATIDHVIPKSKKGTNRLENLKLAHASCNQRRGNKDAPPLKLMSGSREPKVVNKGPSCDLGPQKGPLTPR